jgi:hypothetical protein
LIAWVIVRPALQLTVVAACALLMHTSAPSGPARITDKSAREDINPLRSESVTERLMKRVGLARIPQMGDAGQKTPRGIAR